MPRYQVKAKVREFTGSGVRVKVRTLGEVTAPDGLEAGMLARRQWPHFPELNLQPVREPVKAAP